MYFIKILSLLLVFSFSGTENNSKIRKSTKLKVTKKFQKQIKQGKYPEFKLEGEFIISPKGYLFVINGKKSLLISRESDKKVSDKDYLAYFAQFEITGGPNAGLQIYRCSCNGEAHDSEGDKCDFYPSPTGLKCDGGCRAGNSGETCKLSITSDLMGVFSPQSANSN